MKRYKHIAIKPGGDTVDLLNTDSQTTEWIVNEVKKHIPACETRNEHRDLSGELCKCSLHRLSDKDGQVNRWIMKRLLEEGWEPYAVTTEGEFQRVYDLLYHLRKEVEV